MLSPEHIVKHGREFISRWRNWRAPRYRCTNPEHKKPVMKTEMRTRHNWWSPSPQTEQHEYTWQVGGWAHPAKNGRWGPQTYCYTCHDQGAYDVWKDEHAHPAAAYSRVGLTANAIAMFLGETPSRVAKALYRGRVRAMYCDQVQAAIWTGGHSYNDAETEETYETALKQARRGAKPVGRGPGHDATPKKETVMLAEVLNAVPMKRPMTDRNCYYCRQAARRKRG